MVNANVDSFTDFSSVRAAISEIQSQIGKAKSQGWNENASGFATYGAEICIKGISVTSTKAEKAELKHLFGQLVDQAEQLKNAGSDSSTKDNGLDVNLIDLTSSIDSRSLSNTTRTTPSPRVEPINSRKLSAKERLIVFKSSKLDGALYPPWDLIEGSHGDPDPTEFQILAEGQLFEQPNDLKLSPAQLDHFKSWERASRALPPPSWPTDIASELTMEASADTDLVQDVTTDCSVVASLCTLAEGGLQSYHPVLIDKIWPRNEAKKGPALSVNGKYIIRLYFNGCWRKVVVDDRLPVSNSTRTLHVIDQNNPSLLWPALAEKAYLKVRGGYDFPGSNSCSDLLAFTGWIPEQIFINHEIVAEKLWSRLYPYFVRGELLLTLGTGRMSRREERQYGLEAQHNYAVLDMAHRDDTPMFKVKNPWVSGRAQDAGADSTANQSSGHEGKHQHAHGPSTFWIDIDRVIRRFESVFVNWSPALFKHRQDIHFSWDVKSWTSKSISENPQFEVSTEGEGPVWLQLCRHYRDGACVGTQEEISYFEGNCASEEGFMSLGVYDKNGERLYLDEGPLEKGDYVSTPHTLLRFISDEGKRSYTAVVTQQELLPALYSFTLSAFSTRNLEIREARTRYDSRAEASVSWDASMAVGDPSTVTDDPQFGLIVPQKTPLALLVDGGPSPLPIRALIVHGRGVRVHTVSRKDIILNTGEFTRGRAHGEVSILDAGTYTVICSAFEKVQQAIFTLKIDSTVECKLTKVPKEGAGLLTTKFRQVAFDAQTPKMALPLIIARMTQAYFVVRFYKARSARVNRPPNGPRSPVLLTLELGRGPNMITLLQSNKGDYSDASVVRTDKVNLDPGMSRMAVDMFLVLERLSAPADGAEEVYEIEAYCDAPDAFKTGSWRSWD